MRLLLVLFLAACGTKDGDDTSGGNGGNDSSDTGETADTADTGDTSDSGVDTAVCNTDNEECAPGVSGCGGEGSDMLPGSACISCHSRGGANEAPTWSAAGTLFSDIDGTAGVRSATVIVTDGSGNEERMNTSSSGNFHTNGQLVPPLNVRVEFDGRSVEMASAVNTGDCNSCHACAGEAGGKLYAP